MEIQEYQRHGLQILGVIGVNRSPMVLKQPQNMEKKNCNKMSNGIYFRLMTGGWK